MRDENRDGRVDERDDAVVQDRQAIRDRKDVRDEDVRDKDALGADEAAVVPAAVPVRRPRASALATAGLVLGVLAAAAVATGVLAKAGVAVGALGALVSLGGVGVTRRAHVMGRFDALLGVLLSLAAVTVGLLALGNAVTWPDTDTNQVTRLVDWLDAQLPWLNRV